MYQNRREHLAQMLAVAGLLGSGTRSLAQNGEVITARVPEFTPSTLVRIRESAGIPAISAAYSSAGAQPTIISDGLRSADATRPVTDSDLWHIGSNTKSMTSTLVARAVEQGKVGWDTTVGEILGDAIGTMKEPYRAVNFRHLCSHHAGLTGETPVDGYATDEPNLMVERRRLSAWALEQDPIAAPGEKWLYSNTGYVTAAVMLETVYGEPWEALMQAHIFAPLQLRSAGFGPPGTVGQLDQPLGHGVAEDPKGEGAPLAPARLGDADNPADLPGVYGPAGLAHMSVTDLIAYLNVHCYGLESFLTPQNWQVLHTPPFTADYAMGWLVRPDGSLWHNGSNRKWYAETAFHRESNRVACVTTNSGDLESATPAVQAILSAAMTA
jgi:CubicO group peptidase (beta-lactamase class C family)|tara:strand:- start:26063 stop:27211 length:1149 start_codon:yes stop_codon:yes gene_type:complete